MTERTAVDLPGLLNGGVDIQAIAQLAQDIATMLISACAEYARAGGTGEMGAQFDANYKPGEQTGLAFLKLLNDSIGTSGVRTLKTGHSFANAENEADTAASSG